MWGATFGGDGDDDPFDASPAGFAGLRRFDDGARADGLLMLADYCLQQQGELADSGWNGEGSGGEAGNDSGVAAGPSSRPAGGSRQKPAANGSARPRAASRPHKRPRVDRGSRGDGARHAVEDDEGAGEAAAGATARRAGGGDSWMQEEYDSEDGCESFSHGVSAAAADAPAVAVRLQVLPWPQAGSSGGAAGEATAPHKGPIRLFILPREGQEARAEAGAVQRQGALPVALPSAQHASSSDHSCHFAHPAARAPGGAPAEQAASPLQPPQSAVQQAALDVDGANLSALSARASLPSQPSRRRDRGDGTAEAPKRKAVEPPASGQQGNGAGAAAEGATGSKRRRRSGSSSDTSGAVYLDEEAMLSNILGISDANKAATVLKTFLASTPPAELPVVARALLRVGGSGDAQRLPLLLSALVERGCDLEALAAAALAAPAVVLAPALAALGHCVPRDDRGRLHAVLLQQAAEGQYEAIFQVFRAKRLRSDGAPGSICV